MGASTLRLAWRNLGRNRRRTLVTGATLAIGVSLSVASYGVVDGLAAELVRSLTGLELGHVQVHRRGYPRSHDVSETIPDGDRVLLAARGTPHVLAAGPRVYAYALVSHDERSDGVELVGVDPAMEPRITSLQRHLVAGAWLDAEPTPWPLGRDLAPEEQALDARITQAAEDAAIAEIEGRTAAPPPLAAATRELARIVAPPPARPPRVLVGAGLARALGIGAGDELHATVQAVDGVNQEVTLRVAGVYRTGNTTLDRMRVYLHLADLQHLAHLVGRVHEIAVVADDLARAPQIARAIERATADLPVIVRTWRDLRPGVRQLLDVQTAAMGLMVFIILFVASLGVVNTMLMAVFERTRELGVLKALGLSGARVVGVIVAEALLLVLVASAAGTLAGLGLDAYLAGHGLDLRRFTGGFSVAGVGISPVVHGAITASGLALPALILSLTCVIASLYPALRAARLRPAVGMRET